MEKPIVYLDMDGVTYDFETRLFNLMKIKPSLEQNQQIAQGYDFEKIWPDCFDYILQNGINFWENIPLLPWSKKLYNKLSKSYEVIFLTSPGNYNKRGAKFVADATQGKLKSLKKDFGLVKCIINPHKYLNANPNTILIDDSKHQIDKFKEYKGKTFLWPHKSLILNDKLSFESLYSDLENQIEKM